MSAYVASSHEDRLGIGADAPAREAVSNYLPGCLAHHRGGGYVADPRATSGSKTLTGFVSVCYSKAYNVAE